MVPNTLRFIFECICDNGVNLFFCMSHADYRQHDHWTWVNNMQKFVCYFLGLDGHHSARLGGILLLEGDRFGLACLKGSHFRDSTWALFVLRQVKARYETVTVRGKRALVIGKQSEANFRSPVNAVSLQSFSIGLGNEGNNSEKLLMVEKVSRSRTAPLVFNKSVDIDDWLDLICRKESKSQPLSRRTNIATNAFESRTIFACPSFDFELNTSHYWPELGDCPVNEDDIPLVECSLTSSFRDSVAAATDVDLYLFLHDLIISYRTELTGKMVDATFHLYFCPPVSSVCLLAAVLLPAFLAVRVCRLSVDFVFRLRDSSCRF